MGGCPFDAKGTHGPAFEQALPRPTERSKKPLVTASCVAVLSLLAPARTTYIRTIHPDSMQRDSEGSTKPRKACSAANRTGNAIIALHGCTVARLHGCTVARLH